MDQEEVKCQRCGYFHVSGKCRVSRDFIEPVPEAKTPFPRPLAHAPKLPPADPWDKHQGIRPVDEFQVSVVWEALNEEWAQVQSFIELHDGQHTLSKPVQMRRHHHGKTVHPEMFAVAWIKRCAGSGGVPVLGLHEDNPGHRTHEDGSILFRWWVTVGSRLSVAVVRLEGDLQGQARLILVE